MLYEWVFHFWHLNAPATEPQFRAFGFQVSEHFIQTLVVVRMAERRATNKWYPEGWDPSKGSLNTFRGQHPLRERAKKLDQGILTVRFELPYNICVRMQRSRCPGCAIQCGEEADRPLLLHSHLPVPHEVSPVRQCNSQLLLLDECW